MAQAVPMTQSFLANLLIGLTLSAFALPAIAADDLKKCRDLLTDSELAKIDAHLFTWMSFPEMRVKPTIRVKVVFRGTPALPADTKAGDAVIERILNEVAQATGESAHYHVIYSRRQFASVTAGVGFIHALLKRTELSQITPEVRFQDPKTDPSTFINEAVWLEELQNETLGLGTDFYWRLFRLGYDRNQKPSNVDEVDTAIKRTTRALGRADHNLVSWAVETSGFNSFKTIRLQIAAPAGQNAESYVRNLVHQELLKPNHSGRLVSVIKESGFLSNTVTAIVEVNPKLLVSLLSLYAVNAIGTSSGN